MTREQVKKRNFITRIIVILVGVAAIIWTEITPDPSDLNWTLLILWTLLAARGVYKAGKILCRVRSEHLKVDKKADPQGYLISSGNLRRNLFLFVSMLSFFIIGLTVIIGQTNVTLSRLLIVVILVALEALLEFDDDEIYEFDTITQLRQKIIVPQDPPSPDYDIPQ